MRDQFAVGYKGGGYDPYNSATTSKVWLNRRFGYFAGSVLRLLVAVFRGR